MCLSGQKVFSISPLLPCFDVAREISNFHSNKLFSSRQDFIAYVIVVASWGGPRNVPFPEGKRCKVIVSFF